MRKLKIAFLAPAAESVPPLNYGGTEMIVYHLVEGLHQKGHKITLFASGNSRVSCRLIPTQRSSSRQIKLTGIDARRLRRARRSLNLVRTVRWCVQNKIDIIHSHVGWEPMMFSDFIDMPIVKTFHGPLTDPVFRATYHHFPRGKYVSISRSQQKLYPQLKFAANIYNGIGMEQFKFYPRPRDYFVFVGRISPEKGIVNAIKAAKLAGVNLKIAAKIDPYDQKYFEKEVKHLIDGKQIEFLGEVGNLSKRKADLFGYARGALYPINWAEPFGLVMAEAMAAGTPVIATRMASAPEIVKDGQTGFLVNPENPVRPLAQAMKKIDQIDRRACRRRVEKRFTKEIMVDKYEKLYYRSLGL